MNNYYKTTERLDKINKISLRPKLELCHKWVQGPTKIETKQIPEQNGVSTHICLILYLII